MHIKNLMNVPTLFYGEHPVRGYGEGVDPTKESLIDFLNRLGFDGNKMWEAYEAGSTEEFYVVHGPLAEIHRGMNADKLLDQLGKVASTERGRRSIRQVIDAINKGK